MSVSPPPGGSTVPDRALGGGPGEMARNVAPPSTEPNQTLRCVPVPVGPLENTRPCASMPMSGSPNVWMGSTTVGTWNVIFEAAPAVGATAERVPVATRSVNTVTGSAYLNRAIQGPPRAGGAPLYAISPTAIAVGNRVSERLVNWGVSGYVLAHEDNALRAQPDFFACADALDADEGRGSNPLAATHGSRTRGDRLMA